MTLDTIIGLLAPFSCFGCGRKGWLLCPACQEIELDSPLPRCYRCHKATTQFQVCASCRRSVTLQHVWVCTTYEGLGKRLIEALKFERARLASKDIADLMSRLLPHLPETTVVCPLPTASKRVRIRGYDQSVLLAKAIAKQKNLHFEPVLLRVTSSRQLGSSRKERFDQSQKAFGLTTKSLKGKSFLLVDDVTTSGATIEAAAKILKNAGAKSVDAVVFAQALD